MVYRQILLDSGSCYDPNKPTFNLQSPFKVDRFKVLSAQIPSSFYGTSNANNQIAFKIGTDTYYAQMKQGFWNVTTAPAEIKRALNTAHDNGFNVVYDANTKSLTITGTAAFTILGGDSGTSAWTQLGARKVGPSSTGTSVSLGVADFTGTSAILLVSSQLISRDNILLGGENISVLGYIPCNSQPGSVINWVNNGSYLYYGSDLSYIEIRLLDSSTYNALDLNNNSFQLTIACLTDEDDPVMYT